MLTSPQELYDKQKELLEKYEATTKIIERSNMHLMRAIKDAETWNQSVLGIVEILQVLDTATALTSMFGISGTPN